MKNVFAIAVFALLVSILGPDLRAQSGPYQYTTVTPCRVVDTRNPAGTNGGPAMFENNQRDFQVRGTCGIPSTAKAVSINLTITQASAPSWLIIWPSGISQPQVSTLNFDPSFWALANGAIVGLSSNTKDLSVYNAHGSVHVIVDVTGYFQ